MAAATQHKLPVPSIAGATTALVLLTALNFVNYIDRYILPGVQEQVKGEFHVSDAALGSLTLWFFVTYMFAAPATGWLGDRFPRKPLIVGCALLISAINVLTGLVHHFDSLLLRHAVLGIGEASFGIYAPALLSDFYPEDQRNRVLTIFYTAIPVGAALGYLVGEIVGSKFGWRVPFYVSAVPGFLIAVLIFFWMKEPERGASDPTHDDEAVMNGASGSVGSADGLHPTHRGEAAMNGAREGSAAGGAHPTHRDEAAMNEARGHGVRTPAHAISLATNAPYLYATLGMAAITFSLGGISAWMPSFLQRSGFSPGTVGITLGAITAGAGLGGTAVGGWIAQRWLRTNHRALYLISAWSALLTVPFGVACFFGPKATMLPALGVAMFCIFLGTGPLNAAIVNAVPATVRATAIAMELFLIHALGDTPSPKLIGLVSDHSTLGTGLGLTLITMLIATVLLFLGARTTPEAVAT
jgi:MFS family permease